MRFVLIMSVVLAGAFSGRTYAQSAVTRTLEIPVKAVEQFLSPASQPCPVDGGTAPSGELRTGQQEEAKLAAAVPNYPEILDPPPLAPWMSCVDGLDKDGHSIPRIGVLNHTAIKEAGDSKDDLDRAGAIRRFMGYKDKDEVPREKWGEPVRIGNLPFVRGDATIFGGPHDSGVGPGETGVIPALARPIESSQVKKAEKSLAKNPDEDKQEKVQAMKEEIPISKPLRQMGDEIFCAMRVDFKGPDRVKFWAHQNIIVYDPSTKKSVVCKIVDFGTSASVNNQPGVNKILDMSPKAMKALGYSPKDSEYGDVKGLLVAFAKSGAPEDPKVLAEKGCLEVPPAEAEKKPPALDPVINQLAPVKDSK